MTMTDEEKTIVLEGGVLMTIGTVASRNIAAALSLGEEAAPAIETAIKDEIDMLSSHFTLAIADVSTQHEIAEIALKKAFDEKLADAVERFHVKVNEIRSTYNWLRANIVFVALYSAGLVTLGIIAAHALS